jgi:IMP dehydrogenase
MKRDTPIRDTFGFDDVLLPPGERAAEVSLRTRLTKTVSLNIPLLSAPRVTESAMAVAMAHFGGLGVIHADMPLGRQVEEVRKVKRAESDVVQNPVTIAPEASAAEALDLMTTYSFSGLPVVEQGSQKVCGIVTRRDLRFFEDWAKPVSELMTREVVTAKSGVDKETIKRLLHQHRVEKIVLVDDQGRCTGLVTVKDIEKFAQWPGAARDKHGRLLAGAAVSVRDGFERAMAMADAGLDVVFVDVPHAHSRDVMALVSRIRQQRTTEIQIVAGNVATAAAARSLIDAGADALKVGADCKMKFSALLDVAGECAMADIPVILDGARDAGMIVKALGAGAESVALSCLLAGCDEAVGEISFHENRPCKPGADSPYRGAAAHTLNHLIEGVKTGMAQAGGRDAKSLAALSQFVKVK